MVVQIGTIALGLMLIVLPLAHVNSLRSLGFITAAVCAAIVFVKSAQRDLPLLWIFVLWLTAALLSLISSQQPALALEAIWDEAGKSAVVFYTAYLLAQARPNAGTWSSTAAASLALVSILSIASALMHGDWLAVGPVPALGEYATSALTLIPLVLVPLFGYWRELFGPLMRSASIGALMLATTGGILTMSRAFWLVGAVMYGIVTAAWARSSGQGWRNSFLRIGAILLASLLLAAVAVELRTDILKRAPSDFDLLTFKNRLQIYAPVFNRLLEAPLTGFGYGHESSKAWYLAHMGEYGVLHAHNLTLSYIEQMGLPGLAALIGIFGGLGVAFVRHIASPDRRCASLAALGCALVAGIFVKNNLDIFFVRHNLLLFFLCCGLLLGSLDAMRSSTHGRTS